MDVRNINDRRNQETDRECVKSVRIITDIKMSFGPLWIKKLNSTAGIP